MAMTIAASAKTYRNVTWSTAGRTAGYDQVQFQVGTRADFLFGLAPLYNYAGAASIVVGNLNQANLYWFRARERRSSDGAVLPWTTAYPIYTPWNDTRVTAPLSLMVQPAILVVPEPVTWSAPGGYDAGYPPANLASDAPQEQLWTSYWPTTVDFDTAGQPIDTIALLATNTPAGAQWYALAYNTPTDRTNNTNLVYQTTAVQFHASAAVPGRDSYHGLMRLPSPRSEVYWRIYFTDPASTGQPPAARAVITYGVVGLARTAKNIAADKTEGPMDYGSVERTRDGIPDRRLGFRGRKVEFEISVMTEAQWETQFSDLRQRVGLTDPVLVVPNSRAGAFLHDRILYGPLSTSRVTHPYATRFSQQFSIDSLI